MEHQINRIQASLDLRHLNVAVAASSGGKSGLERIHEVLTLELGDTCKVRRPTIVSPEPGAKAKFMSVM